MEIDNLSVSLKTNGADDAIQKIYVMAKAVDHLANSAKAIDSAKLQEFANGLKLVSSSAPNKAQANNMSDFADAIGKFVTALSGANITQVANDISNISESANSMGSKSERGFRKATNAARDFAEQTKQAAQAANSVKTNAGNASGQNNAEQIVNSFRQLNGELNKVAISADSIGGKLSKMGLLVPTKQFKSLGEQADKIKAKYEELRNTIAQGLASGKLTEGSDKFANKQRELEALRNEYDRLILKQRELALAGDGFKINPTIQAGLDGFKKGFNGVISVVKGGFVSAIKSANHHISSFIKNLSGANSAQKAFQKTMSSMKSLPTKIAKEITRLGKMLKLMVVRKALRAVITEIGNGFQSLALHSDQFNESMSNLINGSKQLGYSFSAMVSPLINALAPALVYIIDLLIKLLNVINQVFSALSGATTWNKAKKFTDSWRDSINEANASAGKLKKTVLGFDELNQLQEKTTGKHGGKDIADMFETVKIDPKWKEFADWLKEMWKNKDFYDLGKLAGEKLRDWLESIPWDEIRQTANDLGKATATLINGFVEVERLGYDIGKTVAQGVNTVFEYINGFVHNLHWGSIGKFIADTFNGFFENIDWDLIKDTVVTGLRGIATAIWQFIQEFHWDNISKFITNAFDTVAAGIRAFFETEGYDERGFKLKGTWAQRLGSEIGYQLKKAMEDIPWREVGTALGDIIQAAIEFASGLVDSLPSVDTLVEKSKELVEGLFDQVDSEQLGTTVATILNNVYDFLVGFWNENGATIKAEVKKFFQGFWNTIDKDDLKDVIGKILEVALLAGIGYAFGAFAIAFMKAKLQMMINTAIGASTVKEAAMGAGASLGSMLLAGISSAFIVTSLIIIIKQAFEDVKKYKESLGVDSFWDAIFDVSDESQAKKFEYAETKGSNPYAKYSSGGHSFGKYREELNKTAEDTKKLTDTTKELSDQAVKTSDGLKLSSSKFSDHSTTIYQTTENAKKLSDNFKTLSENTTALKTNNEATTKTFSEFKAELEKAGTETTNTTTSLSKITGTMSDVGKSTSDLSKTASSSFGTLSKDTKTVTENIPRDFANAQKSTSASFHTLTQDATKSMGDTNKTVSTNMSAVSKTFTTDMGSSQKTVSSNMSEISKITSDNMGSVSKSVSTNMGEISKSVSSNMGTVQRDVDSSMKEVNRSFDTIKSGMDKESWTFSGVAEGLKKTFESAKEAVAGVWNSIADKLNGDHDVGGSSFHINLPKFAGGGFPEDGLFMANHNELVGEFSNGKTAVANNEMIISGIERGVYSAVSAAMANNNSGSAYISNEIVVDGEVIARSITKAQEKMNRRYSPQTV